jgi:ABC-type phosphate transport system substrate-binding protein
MRRLFFLLLVALSLAVLSRPSAADNTPAYIVVINAKTPYVTLDRDFVADAFLKKTTRWPNGDVIKPIDLAPDSPVRARFSEEVLKRSVAAVKSYWQQMIFSGRDIPPTEVSSDDDVIKFVIGHPGAIGYVSGTANLGEARAATVKQ